tara:strand:- start:563 stop:904 length:342 start_codon:yes stop_codon:yes gene_type:complete
MLVNDEIVAPILHSDSLIVDIDSYLVYFYTKRFMMARQSITLTDPNDEWLKNQVDKNEYASKSELINDLIRQARSKEEQLKLLRLKLEHAENSGFTTDSMEEIIKESKSQLDG